MKFPAVRGSGGVEIGKSGDIVPRQGSRSLEGEIIA